MRGRYSCHNYFTRNICVSQSWGGITDEPDILRHAQDCESLYHSKLSLTVIMRRLNLIKFAMAEFLRKRRIRFVSRESILYSRDYYLSDVSRAETALVIVTRFFIPSLHRDWSRWIIDWDPAALRGPSHRRSGPIRRDDKTTWKRSFRKNKPDVPLSFSTAI